MKRFPKYILMFLVLAVALESASCSWFRRDANKDNTQMGKAQQEADLRSQDAKARQAALDAATSKTLSEVRASVQNAKEVNAKTPENPQQLIIKGELSTADQKLESVTPDQDVLNSLAGKEKLAAEGKKEELAKIYAQEAEAAKAQSEAIRKLTAQRDQAIAEAEEARAREKAAINEYVAQAKKNAEAHEKEVKDLKSGITRKTQLWLSISCYIIAVLCLVAAGLIGYLSVQAGAVGLGSLKRVSLPVMFSLLFFGLGWLTTKPWFWWACGITFGLALLAFIILVVIDARKAGSTAQEKTKIQQVGDDLVTAINDIREVLKNPPMELVSKIMRARTVEEATATIQTAVKGLVDGKLKEYVTEADGTAAYVDSRRRKLGLVP